MDDPYSNLQNDYIKSKKELQTYLDGHREFFKKYYSIKVPKKILKLDNYEFEKWMYSIEEKVCNKYGFDIEFKIENFLDLRSMLEDIDISELKECP